MSTQTEVCDDTYTKNCQISFVEESMDVDVGVCHTEARDRFYET
jgi:hypothetical protein